MPKGLKVARRPTHDFMEAVIQDVGHKSGPGQAGLNKVVSESRNFQSGAWQTVSNFCGPAGTEPREDSKTSFLGPVSSHVFW